jgi:K(+)-stimulated pyrophosphate-energized sodium pump
MQQMFNKIFSLRMAFLLCLGVFGLSSSAFASGELGLAMPVLDNTFVLFGMTMTGAELLTWTLIIPCIGLLFGFFEYSKIKRLPVYKALDEVSALIYSTCKSYMLQQGKFLIILQSIIAVCIVYYFSFLLEVESSKTAMILCFSVIGVLGSYTVSWFGIRLNTLANSRTAFASLKGKPFPVMSIPLQAGMSIGLMLVSVELLIMISILLFVSPEAAGACFLGFAIGESLGASALRICGGIFTKIADIGADLMKIVFKIKEDDARNPGVIADCTGDNAGDSVGPTADGFESYGVTMVALITFILLAVGANVATDGSLVMDANSKHYLQADLLVWMFFNGAFMVVTSLLGYFLNNAWSSARYSESKRFNFEIPLTSLIWLTSVISIIATYAISYWLLGEKYDNIWWKLASIMSCGTIAAALIPEFTKIFTSSGSIHVREVVDAAREGGASLAILSGLVAGNFSAFWKGLLIIGLMGLSYFISMHGLENFMVHPAIFAFGLVAYGLLSLAPVTIAVDGYGPISDNAQSVFELSEIESKPEHAQQISKIYGFNPDFEMGKHFLEDNDSAGNTFKATAKPVLIGTAVIGATTMIFSLVIKHNLVLDLVNPEVLLGLIAGGSVVYWFCGASMQAVTTGAFRAVQYIKNNINLESGEKASEKDSKAVVTICTQFAQAGMINIFGVIFSLTVAFACFSPVFFAAYLVSIAVFGLFQALFMANAGGAWDNAKKYVEVDLKDKSSDLHAATVVGDTVGDPFKDTSSVALNPVIKFTTLFGLLAVDIALASGAIAQWIGGVFFFIGLFFVHRSFYGMRINENRGD